MNLTLDYGLTFRRGGWKRITGFAFTFDCGFLRITVRFWLHKLKSFEKRDLKAATNWCILPSPWDLGLIVNWPNRRGTGGAAG